MCFKNLEQKIQFNKLNGKNVTFGSNNRKHQENKTEEKLMIAWAEQKYNCFLAKSNAFLKVYNRKCLLR